MNSGLLLGRVWGFPVRLHLSWFLIFVMVAWSLAIGYFPLHLGPNFSQGLYWALGVSASLLFALSILLHELGHAWVALHAGVPVKGVTLLIFGGVAQIDSQALTAGSEFRIALIGPLVSAGLGGLFWVAARLADPALATLSDWMAEVNLSLALFNLVPGFPLDGGRVLRALVWKIKGDEYVATRFAARSGQVAGWLLMGAGALSAMMGGFSIGLWLIFIGWFLKRMASTSLVQAQLQHILQGLRVEQLMQREFPTVPGRLALDRLVAEHVVPESQRLFSVTSAEGAWGGMLNLNDVLAIPRQEWPYHTAEQVMVPGHRLLSFSPDLELIRALEQMERADLQYVPVVEDGELHGFLSRGQVIQFLHLQTHKRP